MGGFEGAVAGCGVELVAAVFEDIILLLATLFCMSYASGSESS